jgi:hypothetical protein
MVSPNVWYLGLDTRLTRPQLADPAALTIREKLQQSRPRTESKTTAFWLRILVDV